MDLESLALRVKRSENLPVLPQVASTVLKMADDPRTGAKDLERTIERDMSLATKILKVANSSYYGMSNISSIGRAVSVLGINTVRSLVVSLAYQQMVSGRTASQLFQRSEFWSHSLGVGITARVVSKMILPQKAEELYLAGLMHDVGMLVLDRFLPAEFDSAIKMSREEKISMAQAEEAVFGYNHAQVGGLLAERWGLSPAICNAVTYHHAVAQDDEHCNTTSIIAVANGLAHQSGLSNHAHGSTQEIDEFALATLGINEEQLSVIGVVMVQEVVKAQQSFQINIAA